MSYPVSRILHREEICNMVCRILLLIRDCRRGGVRPPASAAEPTLNLRAASVALDLIGYPNMHSSYQACLNRFVWLIESDVALEVFDVAIKNIFDVATHVGLNPGAIVNEGEI